MSAPTNAGKTLVGLLILLHAIHRGQRAVFIEPLRAVAREKFEELQAALPCSGRSGGAGGCAFASPLATTGEITRPFCSPRPDRGELVIATPERLDALLRDPTHDPWFASVGAVAVDEAHLICSPGRGATLEFLITSLSCLPSPPRMVLLSASLGDLSRGRAWLAPCDILQIVGRSPPLQKEVWVLEQAESADEAVAHFVGQTLAAAAAQVLVFVYQTRSAESLAERLRAVLGPAAGLDGPLAYHSQMSAARREEVRQSFHANRCRCVVATTALALGVNLPASHVCIRDLTFHGVGLLRPEEVLQMMGGCGPRQSSGPCGRRRPALRSRQT